MIINRSRHNIKIARKCPDMILKIDLEEQAEATVNERLSTFFPKERNGENS